LNTGTVVKLLFVKQLLWQRV